MQKPKIGIIGGSGLYQMEGLEVQEERRVTTPFGEPSDVFILGTLEGVEVAFLARHGRGHVLSPSELNFRANIYALKSLGCHFIISVSAVGSLKEEVVPGHLVMVDQFIDRTKGRMTSFFGNGIVAHVPFADPVCSLVHSQLCEAAKEAGADFHDKGTYVCIEGPMFSTKAESELYRRWGCDVIGMTNYQEAKLAREAQLSYATLALSTDYDCWHPDHDSVTADMVIATLNANVALAQKVLKGTVPRLAESGASRYVGLLKNAVVTDVKKVSSEAKQQLALILQEDW